MRMRVEGELARRPKAEGYCVACDAMAGFTLPRSNEWIDLREAFLCPGCGLSGRGRTMLWLLRTTLGALVAEPPPRALLLEQITPLFQRVQAEFAFVTGSEFLGPDCRPGEVRRVHGQDVRHEDLQQLSFQDAELDVVFHGDVLEHVPDHRQALRECARVLRPGGQLIMSAPFYDLEEHLVRAEVLDGELVHHLEPAYHGNPMSKKGSLVFNHHGWPLLDDIRAAGFATVEIGLLYDPNQGIVSNNNPYREGHMWPIVFRARKA